MNVAVPCSNLFFPNNYINLYIMVYYKLQVIAICNHVFVVLFISNS